VTKPYQFFSIESLGKLISNLNGEQDQKLVEAVRRMDQGGRPSLKSYLDIRDRFCAVNLVLNEKNLIAPAFRPFRRLLNNKGLSHEDSLLGCDRQVIDLHYLFCNHHGRPKPSDNEYKSLFISDEFDYKLASSFASKNWSANHKAGKTLRLTTGLQKELAVLKEKSVYDGVVAVLRKVEKIEVSLYELLDSPDSRFLKDNISDRIEELTCIALGKGSITDTIKFYKLRGGEVPVDDKSYRRLYRRFQVRKKWFVERLGCSRW
jgi:hypothetical protein